MQPLMKCLIAAIAKTNSILGTTLIGMLLLSLAIIAATQNQSLSFSAATIKLNKPSDTSFPGGYCHGVDTKVEEGGLRAVVGLSFSGPALGRCGFNQTSLRTLIGIAYGIEVTKIDQRVLEARGWMNTDKYRIEAVAPNPSTATAAQLSAMLQNLLADRFKLKLRRETRDLSGYALVVVKNGPKLEEGHGSERESSLDGAPGRVRATNMRLSALADVLSIHLGQPVVDETAVQGRYNFTLTWTPGQADANGQFGLLPLEARRELAGDPNGPSVFTALQEQLGLRLESKKVPTDVIVIDHAEKPDAN